MISKPIKINNKFLLPVFAGVLLLALTIFPARSGAAIPKLINFQGKLTKTTDGTNVTDGNYGMQFKIYDASTSGNLLWTETWDATTTQVSLVNGVFSVKLGSITSLGGVDFSTGNLYLTVNFSSNGGTTYDGEMLPRKQLVAAPFAFNANNLVGDGRIAITTTSTTQSAMQVTYNPDSATSTPAAIISASSNVTGPALKVVQSGSGAAALFSGGNVGIGSSTPAALLSVQGSAGSTVDLFSVASSTNASLFKVQSNGSTTVASLGTGLVRTTSSGSLFNGQAILTTDVTGVLPVANGGTGTSTVPTSQGQILADDGTHKFAPTTLIAGSNITITTTTPGQITIASSASGGGNSAFTIGNGLIYNATSTDLVGIGTITPTTTLFVQGKGGTNPFAVASSSGVQLLTVTQAGNVGIGSTSPVATLGVTGTLNVSASATIVNLSSALPVRSTVAGSLFNGAISLASGSNDITGILAPASGGTGTSTAPSQTGQILGADSTGTKYGPVTLINGSNITITTSTAGQITIAAAGSGLAGAGTNGLVARWTTASNLSTGVLLDNGTVAGVSATTSEVALTIQGTAINDNSGNSTVSRGLYINPSITGATDFRALERAPYTFVLASTTAITQAYGNLYGQLTVNTTTAATLAGASSVYINGAPKSTSNLTISSSTALTVIGGIVSSTTNAIGLYVQAPTGAQTANYAALLLGGNVGIGSTSPVATLGITGTLNVSASTTIVNLSSALPVRSTVAGSLFNGAISLASGSSDITGVLAPGSGGTGTSTAPTQQGQILLADSTGAKYAPGIWVNGTNIIVTTSTVGQLSIALSGVVGVTNGGTATSAAPTVTGQLLAADGTGTKYAPTNLVAGSNITITTATPGQITIASSGGGTNYWSTLANGIYNNAASGYLVGINSTTPTANLVVQGSSTAPTLPIFVVASSSNAQFLTVTQAGNIGINSSTPGAQLSIVAASSTAGFYLTGLQGPSSNGTVAPAAPSIMTILGATGSDNTRPSGGTGGIGGAFAFTGGTGGTQTGSASSNATGGAGGAFNANGGVGGTVNIVDVSNIGGAGGAINLQGGVGGDATGVTTNFNRGGAGGALTFQAGSGGSASNSSGTNTGGAGGILELLAGNAGAVGNANGGNVNITGGTANGTGNTGNVILGVTSAGVTRGNIGVGTSTLVARLSITGSAAVDPFDISSTSGVSLVHVTQGGNVGIGTTNPSSLLQVAGDIQLGSKANASSAALVFNTGSTTNQSTIRFLATTTLASSYNLTLPTTTPVAGLALVTDANGNLSWASPAASLSGGTKDLVTRWLSASTVGTGVLIDNGTVAGVSATTSEVALTIQGTAINDNSGNSTVSRGLYINPSITGATDFRALEIPSYTFVLASTTGLTQAYGTLHNQITINTTTAATLANASNVYINGAPKSTSNLTISSSTALTVIGGTVSSTTNAIGLWLQAPTGAANNYAAIFNGGNVGIGTASPTALLSLQGSAGSTAKLFSIVSSTGQQMFTVQSNSIANMSTLTATPTGVSLVVFNNCSGCGTLTVNTTYFFKIVALDRGTGTTTASSEASQGTGSAGGQALLASWNPVAGASQYAVFVGTSSGNETSYFLTPATSFYLTTTTVGQLTGTIPTSSTAYAIGLNPSGTSWFNSGNLGVGQGALVVGPGMSSVSTSSQLTVLSGAGTITRVSQSNLADFQQPDAIYVQGRYAYIAEGGGKTNAFEIFDVSNPTSPTRLSQSNLSQGNSTGGGNSIYVQGHYAYIAEGSGTSSAFEIFDVSNPSSPSRLGQANLVNGGNDASADAISVQGRYAYIVEGGNNNKSFEIFDVSQPAFPVLVSQTNTPNNAGDAIVVQGRYAYIDEGSSFAHSFSIFDVSNPYAPFQVSQADKTAFDGESLYVQGRYAYSVSGGQAGDKGFDIFDISNPTATPTLVSSTLMGTGGTTTFTVFVQGRYAYIAESGNQSTGLLETFDVSNPASPVLVNQSQTNYGSGQGGVGMFVQGRYAYLAEGGGTTGAFEIFDIGGAYVQQLETGGIETGSLSVRNDVYAYNASFGGGVTVGASLLVNGMGDIVAASSTNGTTDNIFSVSTAASNVDTLVVLGNGNVGIGTQTPTNALTVIGAISSSNLTNGNCVQAGAGGVLTTTGSACGSGGGSGNTTFTIGNGLIYNATSTDLVGIGTITPTTTLFVQGKGGTNPFAIASSTGTQLLTLTQAGNLGIGLTNPQAKLALQGSSGQTTDLLNIASSTGSSMLKVSAWGGLVLQTNSTTALSVLDLSGNSVLNVDSTNVAGNSGIDITGGSSQTGMLLNIASSTGTTMLQVSAYGGLVQNVSSTTAVDIQNGSGANVLVIDSTNKRIGFNTSTPLSSASWSIYGNGIDILDIASSSGSSYFHITAAGNIGISSTTPSGRFAIQGSGTGATNDFIFTDSNNAQKVVMQDTGNVGIGSSSPTALLALQGSSGSVTDLLNVASSTAVSQFIVKSNGNVGIGTSAPAQTLTVAGTANIQTITNTTTAFQVQNAAGAPIFMVDTTSATASTSNNNLISNPGFEVNTAGWGATGTNASIARITAHKYLGLAALQINTPAGVGAGATTTLFTASITTGTNYTLSFYARADSASSSNLTFLQAGWATSTVISACALNSTTVSNLGWNRYSCSFTTSAVSVTNFQIYIGQSDANSRTFYIDSVQLQLGSSVTPYMIGNIQLRGVINTPVALQALSNSVTAFQIQDTAGTANLFVADTLNGRIGIGTSSPLSRVSIQNSTTSMDSFDIASSSGASFMRVTFNGRVGFNTSTPSAANAIEGLATLPTTDILRVASSSNAVFFNVTAAGRVGINTTSPTATLAIQTQAGVNAFTVASSTGASTTYFTITSNGNVGIATSVPVARFAVAANCFNFATNTPATSTGKCTDYAEYYPSTESVDKGEIVSAGKAIGGIDGLVRKSNHSYDVAIIGVVSTNPAVIVEGNSVQMMNGADYQLNPYRPAVALAGRVPVKITGNEAIHAGDFITSSNISGVGMKAVRSGEVIGQALEDFDPNSNTDPNPTVLVFIKPGYQAIGNPLDLSALTNSLGLDFSSLSTAQNDILKGLNSTSTSGNIQYITTDRLVAGLDVTTQQLSAKTLNVDKILPALSGSVNINLPVNGQFVVGSGLTLDAVGNANFAGSITAPTATITSLLVSHIVSPDLDALTSQIAALVSSGSSSVASLQQQINDSASSTQAALAALRASLNNSATSSTISLQDLAKAQNNGLTFSGPVTFAKGLTTNSITALDSGGISVNGDVYFVGTPYFNSDTAGFAIIKSGDSSVDIAFSQAYLDQPIVNASISANATSTAGALDLFAQNVFNNGVQFIITNKSEAGFSILLNKPSPTDIQFSWIALAVRSAKTFSSKNLALPVAETVTTSSSTAQSLGNNSTSTTTATTTLPVIPQVAGASTTASSTLPTAPAVAPASTGTSTLGSTASPAATQPAAADAAPASATAPAANSGAEVLSTAPASSTSAPPTSSPVAPPPSGPTAGSSSPSTPPPAAQTPSSTAPPAATP